MRLITADEKALTVPSEWMARYRNPLTEDWHSDRHEAIYEKLVRLRPLDAGTVVAIIGNDSWTHVDCGSCGMRVNAWFRIPNDGNPVNLCCKCVIHAARQAGL